MKSPISFSLAAVAFAMSFVTPVYAEAGISADSGFASLIPLLLIMVIFYFLLIRPQQKKLKDHRNMVDSLKKGDKVMTGGGIHGRITAVKDDTVKVEIASNVIIKVSRDTVAGIAEIEVAKTDKPAKTTEAKD